MNKAIGQRIEAVVKLFKGKFTWQYLEPVNDRPPLYFVKKKDSETKSLINEVVLWNLMEGTDADELQASQLYKLLEDIENQGTAKQFAQKLLENQKPMPAEFAKILTDNFWELV